jgi:cytochrome bd-type quinol oxidase subunit 2
MRRKLIHVLIVLVSGVILAMPLGAVHRAVAQDIAQNIKTGACLSLSSSTCLSDQSANDKINQVIKTIINTFSLIVGVVSVIMIIVGGFKYITSGGDSNNVSSAKNTIIFAIVGLVIVALAQVIVRFVLTKLTGGESSV